MCKACVCVLSTYKSHSTAGGSKEKFVYTANNRAND